MKKPRSKPQQDAGETREILRSASQGLEAVLADPPIAAETPIEVLNAMELAVQSIRDAMRRLSKPQKTATKRLPGAPTDKQGQFLAFTLDYMIRHPSGASPTHAELQKFFGLTAPSVNSMLIRLERLGFIRRVPNQPRSIELTIERRLIPRLESPFRG